MKVSYYPGCSLESTARDYAESIQGIARRLDIQLEEIDDWSCCGATAAHSLNEFLSIALPTRNLLLAEAIGQDVVVPCALCFNRLKAAEKVLLGPEAAKFESRYLTHMPHMNHLETGAEPEAAINSKIYQGKVKIWDLLDYFTQEAVLARIQEKLKRPLQGLKTVCYYGCLVARPPRVTDSQNYEDPTNMDRLVELLGAKSYPWSYKTDCCGAGLAVSRPDIIDTLVQRLYERALEADAECFVVSCQMCQANLDMVQSRISHKFGKHYYLPVLYFTELIGLALGHPEVRTWLKRHFVNPFPLLMRKGFLE
ncbi:MAG: CoB--CoM heterodisulfide reductase iron-sulfur subunit B family protein [Deltaproteobacteria bacterium]|nr:CoB--CoM heterodisulfide reductase iron-sulfur subunit B family protein [Deltaproteobacteria bacterium]MBW1952335.1 CoB--CoM heterodisulfide reductase iron-sulfur subunit B family protein [Deltaproteobacteria bacterium]MBW1986526.1 CoB--CoM heterodisulfide reductase iron-sulfur subunit B family protein [Deltaproteobacteria bacterium]MBW2135105.1 CoB--CoM heterodisulfide reductase iron-sulfur subunit B family protein [Deltaproteobacteria bacterium]